MGRRRCCCDRPCVIVEDDFDRGDSPDIGSKWVEEAGDPEIVSNELSLPVSSSVRTVKSHPVGSPSGNVTVALQTLTLGAKGRVTINHIDEDNYVYGEVEITQVSPDLEQTYRLGIRSGGSDTVLFTGSYSPVINPEIPISLCRDKEGVYLTAGESPEVVYECISDNGGRKAGIVNPSSSVVIEMDDFEFREHDITNEGCAFCSCRCEGQCIPKTLTLTIVTDPADEICDPCLGGTSTTLTFNTAGNEVGLVSWTGSIPGLPLSPDFGCSGSETYDFRLECRVNEGPSGEQFFLCDEFSSQCKSGSPVACDLGDGDWEVSHVCDPFEVVFPGHNCASQAGVCAFHYLVTE